MSDKVLDELNKEILEARMHLTNIKAAFAECQDDLRRLEKTKEIYTGSKATKLKNKTSVRNVSKPPQGTDDVLDYMREHPDQEHTTAEIVKNVGLVESTTQRIMVYLRESEQIDLVRVGGVTGQTKFYKVALTERV